MGSMGPTSVKEMLGSLLSKLGSKSKKKKAHAEGNGVAANGGDAAPPPNPAAQHAEAAKQTGHAGGADVTSISIPEAAAMTMPSPGPAHGTATPGKRNSLDERANGSFPRQSTGTGPDGRGITHDRLLEALYSNAPSDAGFASLTSTRHSNTFGVDLGGAQLFSQPSHVPVHTDKLPVRLVAAEGSTGHSSSQMQFGEEAHQMLMGGTGTATAVGSWALGAGLSRMAPGRGHGAGTPLLLSSAPGMSAQLATAGAAPGPAAAGSGQGQASPISLSAAAAAGQRSLAGQRRSLPQQQQQQRPFNLNDMLLADYTTLEELQHQQSQPGACPSPLPATSPDLAAQQHHHHQQAPVAAVPAAAADTMKPEQPASTAAVPATMPATSVPEHAQNPPAAAAAAAAEPAPTPVAAATVPAAPATATAPDSDALGGGGSSAASGTLPMPLTSSALEQLHSATDSIQPHTHRGHARKMALVGKWVAANDLSAAPQEDSPAALQGSSRLSSKGVPTTAAGAPQADPTAAAAGQPPPAAAALSPGAFLSYHSPKQEEASAAGPSAATAGASAAAAPSLATHSNSAVAAAGPSGLQHPALIMGTEADQQAQQQVAQAAAAAQLAKSSSRSRHQQQHVSGDVGSSSDAQRQVGRAVSNPEPIVALGSPGGEPAASGGNAAAVSAAAPAAVAISTATVAGVGAAGAMAGASGNAASDPSTTEPLLTVATNTSAQGAGGVAGTGSSGAAAIATSARNSSSALAQLGMGNSSSPANAVASARASNAAVQSLHLSGQNALVGTLSGSGVMGTSSGAAAGMGAAAAAGASPSVLALTAGTGGAGAASASSMQQQQQQQQQQHSMGTSPALMGGRPTPTHPSPLSHPHQQRHAVGGAGAGAGAGGGASTSQPQQLVHSNSHSPTPHHQHHGALASPGLGGRSHSHAQAHAGAGPSAGPGAPPPSASRTKTIAIASHCPEELLAAAWAIDDFALLRKLYEGSLSVVCQAQHKRSARHIALKIYKRSRLHEMERFQLAREICLHIRIQHPHIVSLLAAWKDSKYVYLALEWAPRGNLFDYLVCRGGRLGEAEAASVVVRPLLAALTFLHAQQFIHRDVKLENIMLDASCCIKLADFGLAIDLKFERANTRLGTFGYFAPEVLDCPLKKGPFDFKEPIAQTQAQAQQQQQQQQQQGGEGGGISALTTKVVPGYDCKVDVWSAGVVTYELLTGKAPFSASSAAKIIEAIRHRQLEYPESLSPLARDFLSKALQRDPKQRPSAAELLQHPWLVLHCGTGAAVEGAIAPQQLHMQQGAQGQAGAM